MKTTAAFDSLTKGNNNHPSVANAPTDIVSCPRCPLFKGQAVSKATLVNNGAEIICPKCGFEGLVKGSNV